MTAMEYDKNGMKVEKPEPKTADKILAELRSINGNLRIIYIALVVIAARLLLM
jgi:hypothetical protein